MGCDLRGHSSSLALLLCCVAIVQVEPVAHASGVPAAVAAVHPGAGPRWTEHRVIPGERLSEIAERHGVSEKDLIRWNDLDADHVRLRIGQMLKVQSDKIVPNRRRMRYRVRKGDSWHRIARKYNVDLIHLQKRWNRKVEDLHPGDRIILWVDETPSEDDAPLNQELDSTAVALLSTAQQGLPPELPIVAVPSKSHSVGSPGRGRIRRALQLPKNDALYRLRDPAHSYASSHTIMVLQEAIARFRHKTGYAGEVVFNDLSRKGGGRLRPHRSHQSGRDADIRLPLVPGTEKENGSGQVDWDATWALLRSLIDSGQVTYIFLSRPQQKRLLAAAKQAGEDEAFLNTHLQFPGYERLATIRHSPGHDQHFHVRISCAAWESRCRD